MDKEGRVVILGNCDETSAQSVKLVHLALCSVDRADADRPPAALGEFGGRLDRRGRTPKMAKECAKGGRPDTIAADQAQPVEPLVVGELRGRAPLVVGGHAFWPILLSVPAISRWMLPAWRCHNSNVIRMNTVPVCQ
jgi:hypothetical protein